MTSERFAVALQELRRRPARDAVRNQLRAEAGLLNDHSRPADGDVFLEAALDDLARGLGRLESGRGEAPR